MEIARNFLTRRGRKVRLGGERIKRTFLLGSTVRHSPSCRQFNLGRGGQTGTYFMTLKEGSTTKTSATLREP